MSDEQLNTAIDEVARRMTASAPSDRAAFRHRMLARIEGGGAPRRLWRTSFVLTPIAVAAAITIAVFVAREPQKTISPAPDRTATAPVIVPPQTTAPEGPSASAHSAAPRASARLTAARESAPPERGIFAPAPLEQNDVASIAVAPLVVDTMSQESIQLERLDAIAPIAVAPLDAIEEQRRYE
jgi:hypothetical protein